ncbi:hypothetical protein O3M35_010244 [Rhynocoris fuscipes]|uniref:Acyl carrier protein n=2 Tax=Rhynocoris fuscipes TaxID=488301 RepID=A0AAW1CYI5_9HEMI
MSGITTFFNNVTKRLCIYVQYMWYELIYAVIGFKAIIEDIKLKSTNKCPIINKNGEVAIVTGGSRGIGASLVKKLLQCEMTVIIGCRNIEAGRKTIENIRKNGVTSGEAHIFKLDMESFDSIKKFASIISTKFTFLNLLVNNAGIMFPSYHETTDGFESQLQVNYLAPFYLTHLLMPLLIKKESSRVVNVTSAAHFACKSIHFDNMNLKNNFITSLAYAQSKLCLLLFTQELDRQLREMNSNVYVLAVHPGIVNTDLFNDTPLKKLCPWILKYLCKDEDAGATSVLAPCISPSLKDKGGLYLSNCSITTPSKTAQNEILQKELFSYSLKTLKINEFGNEDFNKMAALVNSFRNVLYRNSSVIGRTFTRTAAVGVYSNPRKHRVQQILLPESTYLAIKRCASSSNIDPAIKSEIETRVMNVIKAYDKITADKLKLDSHFINDLGLDSLDHVEVIMAMEDEFGFEIPDGDAEKLLRPCDIIRYIGDRQEVYE